MLGYLNPPLWGPDSFNDGAGMSRLTDAANFIHFNMPNGTSFDDPYLGQADAWDVAAYVISQPRPKKAGLDKDFPNLLLKPVVASYGPYADTFSEKQHKYGPFGPIEQAIAKMRARKGETGR
jgi:thiosulfate dehydrogenase